MAGFRGRAIIYPLLLISGWIAGRVTYLGAEQPVRSAFDVGNQRVAPRQNPDGPAVPARTIDGQDRLSTVALHGRHVPNARWRSFMTARPAPSRTHGLGAIDQPAFPAGDSSHASPTSNARIPLAGKTEPTQREHGGALFGYAYSFWRVGKGNGAIAAPGGQYGGSQRGIILGYDLGGRRDHGLALVARAAATPGDNGEEAALGLRWQRPAALPLSLNMERRVVLNGRDRWAAYAAGGIDSVTLPLNFMLDAYGQLGWTSGGGGGAFFDAQGRAMRKLIEHRGIALKVGAGAWAGGQSGAQRLDIGPTIAAEIPVAGTKLDLRLDWRQRTAGNATPDSGVALTLAAGF